MKPLELIEQTAREGRSSTNFYGSKDRILTMVDAARCTLSPAKDRTAEMHTAAVAAAEVVVRELGKTILGHDADEPTAYLALTKLGQKINYGEFRSLLATTIARMKREAS